MYLISILVQSQIQFQMAIKIMNTLALMCLFSAVAVKCHPGFIIVTGLCLTQAWCAVQILFVTTIFVQRFFVPKPIGYVFIVEGI